jgi:hypothetical protein
MKYKIATSLDVTFNDNFEQIRDEFTAAVGDESPDRIVSAGIELMQAYSIRLEFLMHSLQDHLDDLSKVLSALRGRSEGEE